jgi:hypothetical protein
MCVHALRTRAPSVLCVCVCGRAQTLIIHPCGVRVYDYHTRRLTVCAPTMWRVSGHDGCPPVDCNSFTAGLTDDIRMPWLN